MSTVSHSQPEHNGSVALITGASDRIGAAIAYALSMDGHAVVIHYRSGRDDAEALRSRIRADGGRAEILQADLADRGQRASLVARAATFFGPLTILVNNASIFEPDSAFDVSEELWDQHFCVHAEVPVFLARDFARQLPDGVKGNIVNMIDERVLTPSPAFLSYYLSKAVLWTATRTLAQSLAPSIRVNAIGPGPVLPNARQSQAEFDASVEALPLQQNAGPEAIARGVLTILALPAFTGQMLALDGGEHLAFPPESGPTPRL